jgi:signal peptidase II
MNTTPRWWMWLWISAAVVLVDQASKSAIKTSFRPGDEQVLTSFFSLVLAYNSGAAFSFMRGTEGSRYVFSAVAVAAAVLIVWLLRRGGDGWYCAGLALILGGALGNLWDRLTLGHVVDFILVHWQRWYYPAFNVADSAITVGAALLLLDAFMRRHEREPRHD